MISIRDSEKLLMPLREGDPMQEECMLRRLSIVFGLLAITTAVLGILTANLNITLIGGANPDNKTIALSAALIWIFFGSVLAYQATNPLQLVTRQVVQAALILIAVLEGIELSFSLLGSHFFIETLFVRAGTAVLGPSSSPVSPVASCLAVISSIALVCILRRFGLTVKSSRISGAISICGLLITIISFTFVLSYAYDEPLLYGTQYIPIAGLSALSAFFIGVAVVAAAGPDGVPVKYMIGNSTSAGLLRVFVPLVIGIILVENVVFVGLSSRIVIHDAVLFSATLMAFTLATAFVVALISKGLGRALERAEQELARKNGDLNAMNEELTAVEEELRANLEELTRAQKKVWESEQKYSLIYDLVPYPITLSRVSDGTYTEVNKAWEGMIGYTQNEVIDKTSLELGIYPDSHNWVNLITELRQKGSVNNRELSVQTKFGAPLVISSSTAEVTMGGEKFWLSIMQDITDRKKMETAMRDSEEKFRTIADYTGDWEYWLGPDNIFLYISPSCEQITGYSVQDFMENRQILDNIVHPDDCVLFIEHKKKHGGIEEIDKIDLRIIRKDGEIRWIGHACRPVFSEDGTPMGRRVSNRDITDRKIAEEELKRRHDELNNLNTELISTQVSLQQNIDNLAQAEMALITANELLEQRVAIRTKELEKSVYIAGVERQRLYDVLETLPVYVCLLDADYHMPFANKYFRENIGKPDGRCCYGFLFNLTDPCEGCETYTVMKTKAPHHWFWTGPNGRDYDIYDFPFFDTDGSFLILEMGIDITEQKKAENDLKRAGEYNRNLIEASLDPLVTINPDGTISDVNAATVAVTGFSREELIGSNFSQYFTEPDLAKAGYETVFREGSVTDYPLEIQHQDGHITPVLYNATVFLDESGNIRGVFAAARDITKRKKAEMALQKAHDELEEHVQQRTAELGKTNIRLEYEAEERRKAEEELKRRYEDLNTINAELSTTQEKLLQNVGELEKNEESLRQNEYELKEALAEKEVLLSEVHHRVKNNLTAFISLLSLDGSYEDTEGGRALRKDLQNRARSMALIHETLYRTGKYSNVDMDIYITTLVSQIAGSYKRSSEVRVVVDSRGVVLDLARATTAGLIINELVTNSFKYAFPPGFDSIGEQRGPGMIQVSLVCEDGTYSLTVSDNGCGLPPEFDPLTTKSLGLKLVNFLARHQLRAGIEVMRDKGTMFIFRLNNIEDNI